MSQNQPQQSEFFVFGLIIFFVLVIGWAFWYFLGAYITEGLRWVRIGEVWLLELVTGNPNYKQYRILSMQTPEFAWNQVVFLSKEVVMPIFRWPIAIGLLGLAYWIWDKKPDTQFRTKYSLEALMKAQAQSWPVISPIIKLNPTKTSARAPGHPVPSVLPLFAEALSPEEWIVYNRIPLVNGAPDKDAIRRVMVSELGAKWTGVDALPLHARALFAAFALKAARKRQESDTLLGKISTCWNPDKGLVLSAEVDKEINAIINDSKVVGEALKIASNHAFISTALLGLLKYAREQGGVLAPATFVWLRGVDRSLWYPLNNLGRQSYHPEAGAVICHFMAELNAKRPLSIPRVEPAIDSINTYFIETRPTLPPLEEVKKSSSLGKELIKK